MVVLLVLPKETNIRSDLNTRRHMDLGWQMFSIRRQLFGSALRIQKAAQGALLATMLTGLVANLGSILLLYWVYLCEVI